MRRLFYIGSLISLLGAAQWSSAQAAPTADRAGIAQFGAAWSVANSDYGQKYIQGVSVYGTYEFMRHLGIEGDIHRVSAITPNHIGEDTYLLGPRFVFRYKRVTPYAKALVGGARFKFTIPNTAYTYKMIYAFGGGADMPASRKINLRLFDCELQQWPGFPPNGLSPLVVSFGAAYSFR